ncbi:D-alanine--D-alanine ligase family protein [Zhihengliuella halotolerans]|uniref:D-alanine--D-alanine ligase n=1 Tax=Zhihengliuella halotolerans TaxID=370736 RepID=A0A4Q8ABZ4_9MICC|nr:D-alanine--D-alanine ligase family protein [Zhihengliuella halotolerans]RZU61574.1 D-alanine-D-alanine ligase [Zhihengliuella halotolerans]
MPASPRPRVLLLFGGRSSEHSVSCVTAASVMKAIDRQKYDVIPVGITKTGQWTLVDSDPGEWTLASGRRPEVEAGASQLHLTDGEAGDEISVAKESRLISGANGEIKDLGRVDVVFPLLHGPFGEDGTLQGMLELADLPYVGAGVASSAIGMDKHYMKVVFEAAGFQIGPYAVITDKQWRRDPAAALEGANGLELPLFVKPARAGSSMGITRVDDREQLREAVEAAREHDPKVVIEQGIIGREIECGVLEGRGEQLPRASFPGEISVSNEGHTFYDFEAKYVDDSAALSCPADLPEEAQQAIRRLAVAAFDAVGAEGLARVDFFYTSEGQWVINEINTMPGFTPNSMYPQMWAKTGIEYSELIDELIALALERPLGLR